MEITFSTATLVLMVVQLVFFAFGYGRLSQKVDDFCKRADRLEDRLNKFEAKYSARTPGL